VTGDIVRTAPTYKFQPAYVRMISEVSAEVKLAHHPVKQGKRMTGGRIHADEGNDIGMRELAGGPGLLEESLGERCQYCFNRVDHMGKHLQFRPQRDQILGKSRAEETSRQQAGLATTLAIHPRRIPRRTGSCR